jgi:hypothetical protein
VNWVLPGIVIAFRVLKVKFLHFVLIFFNRPGRYCHEIVYSFKSFEKFESVSIGFGAIGYLRLAF